MTSILAGGMDNMTLLSLARALGLPDGAVVSFYGGGGKTTLMLALAEELASAGRRVVVTTTTRIYRPRHIPGVLAPEPARAFEGLKNLLASENPVYWGKSLLPGDKLEGIHPSWVELLLEKPPVPGKDLCILVEADGSAGMPVKGFGDHEPVLPPASHLAIPVLGADALGGILGEVSHRPHILASFLGVSAAKVLTAGDLARVFSRMVEQGEKQAPGARIAAVINKADLIRDTSQLRELGERVREGVRDYPLLFTDARDKNPVKFVFSPEKPFPLVSCILLAAGMSRRMGRDKLSLPLGGKTLLQGSLEGILKSGVDEVVLVRRPENSREPLPVSDARVRVVPNPDYRQGMASSLQAGLAGSHPHAQGALFALGDQPFIPPEVFDALMNRYREKLKKVLYPSFQGKRGNPVLFDRRAWPLLQELEGDTGGRQALKRLCPESIDELPLERQEILADIDTPDDFLRHSRGMDVNK